MRLPEAMAPLVRVWSHRNYALFMGGMTPNLITLWMQRIGTGWLAWELTHSNAWVGAIVAVDYAPMVFLAPFVGAFADRADPVKVQKIAQSLTLAQSMLLAAFTFAGLMTIEILLVLCLLLGCVHPFSAVARHQIVPATVPKADIPTALAVDSALYNGARFVGPALAGIIVYLWGVGITFALNALGCLSYLAGLYAMSLARPERHPRAHGAGMLGDIAEGLNYVRHHVGMGPIFVLMTIGAIWLRPLQDLLPGFAGQVFEAGPSGLGWLTAGMGVGAMTAAMMIAIYARLAGLTLLMLIGYAVNMLATFAFVATGSLWIAIAMGAVWGFALTTMGTATQALLQSAVDDRIRGRVMSLYSMIYRGAPFLGALVIGVLADQIGLRAAFAFAALLCVVPWLVTVRRRAAITLALEGKSNDYDARLASAARGWAGLQYETLVDLRARLRASGWAERVREAAARQRERGRALLDWLRERRRSG